VFLRLRNGTSYFTLKLADSVQGWKNKWLAVCRGEKEQEPEELASSLQGRSQCAQEKILG
jgi:hypothetical protein